jgi:hypothetical protein
MDTIYPVQDEFWRRLAGVKNGGTQQTPRARRSDPDTSHAAAESIEDSITLVQQRVLEIHRDAPDGLTDEELLDIYQFRFGETAESSPRKRRHDLTAKGLIQDSGGRRKLKTGRKGIVWKLT